MLRVAVPMEVTDYNKRRGLYTGEERAGVGVCFAVVEGCHSAAEERMEQLKWVGHCTDWNVV